MDKMEMYATVIHVLCDWYALPSLSLIEVPPNELSDDEYIRLQEFCANHAVVSEFTGDGIIKTAWYAANNMDV